MTCLFDHEECSAQGAGSNIIPESLGRVYKVLSTKQ